MLRTSFAASLAANMLNSSAHARLLNDQTVTTASSDYTTAGPYTAGPTTTWISQSNASYGLMSSTVSSTFLLDEANPNNSKVQFSSSFHATV